MTEPKLTELFPIGRALGAKPASIVEGVEFLVSGAQRRERGEERRAQRSVPPPSAPT